jgi:hypothetical protein
MDDVYSQDKQKMHVHFNYFCTYRLTMDAKLTLKLNSAVIDKAKSYARKKNTSLSRLIESYLSHITSSHEEADDVTPLVKSLTGVLDIPKAADSKTEYRKHIAKKYSK